MDFDVSLARAVKAGAAEYCKSLRYGSLCALYNSQPYG